MLDKKGITKISMGFLVLALLIAPSLSYADWGLGIRIGDHQGDHFYRYHDHPHFGIHVHFLPHGYYTIRVGGARYYYYDGLYYDYVGGDYVLVDPPIGAYVKGIPSDFHAVIINGRTYYTDNGIYYILTRHHGYKVVTVPVVYVHGPQVVNTQDAFPVNVPNNNGGYTTVIIKKSGNGFVGPQGEFYPGFPKVDQLRVMYGK